jgi:hypothetical protein
MHVKNVWRLTRIRALFLHELTKGHRCRCNEASLLSAFGFTLGPVINLKLDLGPVMCLMAAGGRDVDDGARKMGLTEARFLSDSDSGHLLQARPHVYAGRRP